MARQHHKEIWYLYKRLNNAVVDGQIQKISYSKVGKAYYCDTYEVRKDKQSVMTGAVQSTTTIMQKTTSQLDFKAGDIVTPDRILTESNKNLIINVMKQPLHARGRKTRIQYKYTLEVG